MNDTSATGRPLPRPLEHLADDAYQAVRALNHRTIMGSTAAPDVYAVTGNLAAMAHGLEQLTRQLAGGLLRSLEEFDVYDDNGDPTEQAQSAAAYLDMAAQAATYLARNLERAQSAISLQGHNGPKATDAAAEPVKLDATADYSTAHRFPCPQCGRAVFLLGPAELELSPAEQAEVCEIQHGPHLDREGTGE